MFVKVMVRREQNRIVVTSSRQVFKTAEVMAYGITKLFADGYLPKISTYMYMLVPCYLAIISRLEYAEFLQCSTIYRLHYGHPLHNTWTGAGVSPLIS